jgi:hypothetical protein
MFVQPQKTYKGKTAGHYLKFAQVCETQAGSFDIFCEKLPGCKLMMTDNDDMVVVDYDGIRVVLELSGRAYDKLSSLECKCEASYPPREW